MGVEWDRRVIPRWRKSSFSSLLPETRPINQVGLFKKIHGDKSNPESLLKAWRVKPDLGGAVDLLNFAHNAEFKELLADPAHYLLSGDFHLPEQLEKLSHQILNGTTISLVGEFDLEGECAESFIKEASILKNRLFIGQAKVVNL